MKSAVWGYRDYAVTQAFDPRTHTGIDIGCPSGTLIYAARAGVVERVQTGMVSVRVGAQRDFYLHGTPLVRVGQSVAEGEPVIHSDTVQVDPRYPLTGPHLHFEVQEGFNLPGAPPNAEGKPLDPVPILLAAHRLVVPVPAPPPAPAPAPSPVPPSNLDQARAAWARLGELLIADLPQTAAAIAAVIAKLNKLP